MSTVVTTSTNGNKRIMDVITTTDAGKEAYEFNWASIGDFDVQRNLDLADCVILSQSCCILKDLWRIRYGPDSRLSDDKLFSS